MSKKTTHTKSINKIVTPVLTWIDISRANRESMNYLQKKYSFHKLDIEDCLSSNLVPKVEDYQDYIFMVLLLPQYNKKLKEIHSSEIDIFIRKNLLVTIHKTSIPMVEELFESCKNDQKIRNSLCKKNPSKLTYTVLEKILLSTFPMLEHVHRDIRNLEKKMFSGMERETVRDLLNLKRNIINFRKAMQFHKGMIRRLYVKAEKFFPISRDKIYYDNLIEYTKDIWDTLEIQKENIDALHNTNESLISFRLNDIMKFLTIISVIILPGGLITGLFSTQAQHMPFVQSTYGFFIIFGLVIIFALCMLAWFKKKKWL